MNCAPQNKKATIKKSPDGLEFSGATMATQQTGNANAFEVEEHENSRVLRAVAGITGNEVKRTTIKSYTF